MPCGDAETAPDDTRRYQNASSEASSRYSRSIVRDYLQFVPVCLSLSHLHPVSKNAANPWGQIWVTGFGAGQGAFVGHSGSRKLASGLSRCFDCMAREKQQAGPVPAARFPQAGIARPLPPDPTGRLRSWRRIHWPTESPRQHSGARAGRHQPDDAAGRDGHRAVRLPRGNIKAAISATKWDVCPAKDAKNRQTTGQMRFAVSGYKTGNRRPSFCIPWGIFGRTGVFAWQGITSSRAGGR